MGVSHEIVRSNQLTKERTLNDEFKDKKEKRALIQNNEKAALIDL